MDIPDVEPLLHAVPALLKAGGRFVFSVCHPCFNDHGAHMVEELADRAGVLTPAFGVRVTEYLEVPPLRGGGAQGEPESHYYFHRSLSRLFQACFAVGLVLDGLEEPAYPPGEPERQSFTWANYSQIPPVLVARLRSFRPDHW